MIVGITGASGFFGKNFIKRLDVTPSVDVRSFKGDILDLGAVDEFVSDCDNIVHLAGIVSGSFEDLLNLNLLGTKNLVDCSKKYGVKRLIFASTGAVYGQPFDGVSSYEVDACLPNTHYGLTKYFCEKYIQHAEIPFTILRFPNVYGPGNNKGVIYNFLKDIKTQGLVTILGDGLQSRNYLYIDDALAALQAALSYKGCENIFNIADSELYSLIDVVSVLKNHGLNFSVNMIASNKENCLRILSENSTKAYKFLGWKSKISLSEGIKNLL